MRTLSSLFAAIAIGVGVSSAGSAASNGTVLGQTLAGDSCQLSGTSDILCGDANELAGTLRVAQLAAALPEDPSQRHAFILKTAKDLPGGLSTTENVTCDVGKWLAPQGGNSVLFFCTLDSNNWPRLDSGVRKRCTRCSLPKDCLRCCRCLTPLLPLRAMASTPRKLRQRPHSCARNIRPTS